MEIRARRTCHVLAPRQYATGEPRYPESVERCATEAPMPVDGPGIFTGRTAIYYGGEDARRPARVP